MIKRSGRKNSERDTLATSYSDTERRAHDDSRGGVSMREMWAGASLPERAGRRTNPDATLGRIAELQIRLERDDYSNPAHRNQDARALATLMRLSEQ